MNQSLYLKTLMIALMIASTSECAFITIASQNTTVLELNTKNIHCSYVQENVFDQAVELVQISNSSIRWLEKRHTRKDLIKKINEEKCPAVNKIQLFLKKNVQDALAVIAPESNNSVAIQLLINQKKERQIILYGVSPACPRWASNLIDTLATPEKSCHSKAKYCALASVFAASLYLYTNTKTRSTTAIPIRDCWTEIQSCQFPCTQDAVTGIADCKKELERAKSDCASMNNFESITSEFGKTISGFQMNGASYGSDQQDCIDFKKKGNWLGFAVYDGHAGNETSRWLIGTNNLLDQLLTLATKYEAISSETVTELYKQTDEELKKTKCSRNSQYYYSGSTAVIFIANTETMIGYFINLGDSRAVAVNHSGEIILSTTDHNPRCHKDCRGKMWHANYCEKYRILRAGGVITKQRIESCMWGEKKTSNVSRSFGDFDFKLKTGEDSDTPVSIIPDLYQFDLTKAAHVLLFSDGVIDIKGKGLTNQDVAKLSLDAISQNYNPAQYVCWSAHQKGSIDNISAIVINLHGLINCARKIAATHV